MREDSPREGALRRDNGGPKVKLTVMVIECETEGREEKGKSDSDGSGLENWVTITKLFT